MAWTAVLAAVFARRMQSHFETFAMLDDTPITLDAVIGYAQAGSVSVFLGKTQLAAGPGMSALAVGTRATLKGQRLTISAVVVDVQSATDQTSLTVKLSGGGSTRSWTYEEKVAQAGGAVTFVTVVTFPEAAAP